MTRWPRALAWLAVMFLAAPVAAETLLVVRKSADTLDLVDPGSGLRLFSIPVGTTPHEVSVAPDGRLAVVSNYGSRDRPGSSLSIVDLVQAREVRRIDLTPHTRPHGVAWYAANRIAVTTQGSQSLLVVDPAAGAVVATIGTGAEGSHMVAVSSGTVRAYVANVDSGSVLVTALPEPPAAPGPVQVISTGLGTEGIALSPDGGELWVTARRDGTLTVLDAETLQPAGRIDLAGVPIRVVFAPDGATAYVTCAAAGEVVALDAATRREIARRRIDVPLAPQAAGRPAAQMAPGSPMPVGVIVSADSRTLYVAAALADRVVVLDARTLEIRGTIAVDGEPNGLGVTHVLPRAECHACEAPPASLQGTDP